MANNNKNSRTGFLVQGTILALASLISRIIGLIYRIPLTNIIGDAGNDLYSCAFEIYNNLLIISSCSLPLAVSKLVSANIARGRKNNVYRILKCALIFGTVTGSVAALILLFGAEFITDTIMNTPYSIFAVRVLVPVLLIVAILGVLRGFFQGLGTMMPSAVSQVLEQIANAIVSVWAAYVLFDRGTKIGAVLGNAEQYAAAYGAMGGTIGTGVGAFVGLLFTAFVLVVYLRVFKRQMKKERAAKVDSYSTIFVTLVTTIVPVLLSTTIYNCNNLIDISVYKHIAEFQGYSAAEYGAWNGIYTGKYTTLINVPIAIASALATSSVPALTAAYASGRKEDARAQIATATRFISVIAFPCAVGMGVLASPILQMLFRDSSALAAHMLQFGSLSIIFFSLSTLSNGLLQGVNRMKEPIKNAAIALILQLVILIALMFLLDLNIYAMVFANVSFGFIMYLLNSYSLKKYSGYRQEVRKTFLVPAVSAVAMGMAVFAVSRLLGIALGSLKDNARLYGSIVSVAGILVGVIVYAIVLLLLKGLNEHEIRRFPKGELLVRLAKKFRLLK
jgi:stage V sporulation protein B